MALIQRGDQVAFTMLRDRYHDVLMRNLASKGIQPADCADLAQVAMTRVWDRCSTFQLSRSFRPWLLLIVHRLFLEKCRKDRARKTYPAGDMLEEQKGADASVERGLALAPRHAALNRAFQELPEHTQSLIFEAHVRERPLDAIAEQLNSPVSTIKSRLFRARQFLRERILQLDPDSRS
ncbi:MAG: sigma-70 family RNA polymerase sigma factor [Phycisphaerae bacterium]|nr:sigma-70 family RNA polymerase sigma factor [Phycisphaerae bacterium]